MISGKRNPTRMRGSEKKSSLSAKFSNDTCFYNDYDRFHLIESNGVAYKCIKAQTERGGKRENARNKGLGKTNRSTDTQIENLLRMQRFFPKRSLAGHLVLENICFTIYSALTGKCFIDS